MKEKMFAGYPDVVNVDQLREMVTVKAGSGWTDMGQ